ncbi:unnamed protein product [Closterium sp. NIES-65]|nr:unnamed protein product [Closterium sp. NIES-65]
MYLVYFSSAEQPARFATDKRGKWKIEKEDDLSSLLFSSTTPIPISSPLATTCAGMINPCGEGSCYMNGRVLRPEPLAENLLLHMYRLNPGVNCNSNLAVGSYVCVAPSAPSTTISCTGWYRVMQGYTCPSIWNGANLTMSMFLSIKPGIQMSHQPGIQVTSLKLPIPTIGILQRPHTTPSTSPPFPALPPCLPS